MNEEPHNSSIEPALEARIVALVLGEASDFETDELNRLIGLRPELLTFKLRMESAHGMLQDVGGGEFESPEEGWKLPADRRNTLLAVIHGEAVGSRLTGDVNPLRRDANPLIDQLDTAEIRGLTSLARLSPVADAGLRPTIAKYKSTTSVQWNLTKLTAVVCVVGSVGIIAMSSYFMDERAASEYFYEVAKTDAPKDDVTRYLWSEERDDRGAATDRDAPERGSVLFSPTNTKSLSALSAIRDSLGADATLPSPDNLSDDIQYSPAGPAFKLPEDSVAEGEVFAREPWNRAAATIADGLESTRATAEDSPLIATNDGAWEYRAGFPGGDRNGNGLTEHQPGSPDAIYSDLSFPMAAAGYGNAGNSPRAAQTLPTLDIPDDGAVLSKGLERPPVSSSALSAGEAGAELPGIMIENEEPSSSAMPQGTERANRMSDLASVAQLGEESKESLRGEPDLRTRTASPEQALAQEAVRELAGAIPDFSKDQLDLEAGRRSRVGGNTFSSESASKSIDNIDISGTTAPASGAEDKSGASNLPSRGDGGLGRYVDETAAGYSGFDSGDFSLNLFADRLGKEMPADAKGFAEGKMDGVASFVDSVVENSSRSEIPAQSSMEKMKAAVESSDVQGLQLLNERHAQVDLADGSLALMQNGDARKSDGEKGAGAVAGRDTDWIEKDNKGIEMPDAGPVVLFDHMGVNFDFRFPDMPGNPADAQAFGSPQLTVPDAKAGDGSQVQGNRESQTQNIQTPAALTWGTVVPETAKPEQSPIIDGFNSHRKNTVGIQPKQEVGQAESQKESEGHGHVLSFGRARIVPSTLDSDFKWPKKLAAAMVAPPAGLNENAAAEEPFSTFSLHVSDVSFKLAQAALARAEWPEAAKIRIEEFVNAFDYGDPLPSKGDGVACRIEQSIHPILQQRNLLRVSMRTAAAGRASSTPLRLTFLLDNSGSMERTDRQQTVRRAFAMLVQQLTPIDQVTLISFARQPRLLADDVSGAEAGQLVGLIDELPSEGGTNIEAALQLAFEKAREQQTPDAQNRIILLTDGAVNLGDADPESLSQMVSTMRDAGIAFDAAGISAEGLNDEVLEALTRKGDGRYYLLHSFEDVDDGFARQIAGALRPSAKNVKVQIEFNPKRVGSYKLLGFEKHILKQEDFRNDAVDAAEMAAAEAGVAMYQFEAKPDGEGDVGSVSVRFQDLSTGQMMENRWPIPYEADAPRPDQAAPSLRIATSAALLASKLRGDPLGETVDLQALSQLISGLPEQERNDIRVQQLQQMIEQARQLSEK